MIKKLNITSAGLFQLNGIDVKLGYAIADAISSAMNKLGNPEVNPKTLNNIAVEAYEIFIQKYGTLHGVKDLYSENTSPLFKDPRMESEFKQIPIYFDGDSISLMVSRGRTSLHFPFSIIIRLWVNKGVDVSSFDSLKSKTRESVAHELRHAADYIFNSKNLKPAGFGEDSYDLREVDPEKRNQKYINNPTELKSYAGEVALDFYKAVGGDPSLLNMEKVKEVLQNSRIFKYVEDKNKRAFLQRAYSEFNKMVSSGYGKEPLVPGKFRDVFKKLRAIAKEHKKASDFANYMVPHWERYKEMYEEKKQRGLRWDADVTRDYKYFRKEYLKFYNAFKALKSGENPESLDWRDIPDHYRV